MDYQDYKVSSELHGEKDYTSLSKPFINSENSVSEFHFRFPPPSAVLDCDGDLEVHRKNTKNEKNGIIEIEHSKSTILDLVGLQIWRGALLLCDWILENGDKFTADQIILELGSGVGLTSIIAGMFSPVFCTDIDKGGLLDLIRSNVNRNKHLIKHPINVLELDFMSPVFPQEILESLPKISIVIAADVIYDNMITQAFVRTVQLILSKQPKKTIYVALEKRFVFTIADCDAVAPCYEYFLECMDKLTNITMEQVPLNFAQYFQYDRVKELVLWKITLNLN